MSMDLDEVQWWAERLAPRRPPDLGEDDGADPAGDDAGEGDDGWPAGLGLPADAGRAAEASPLTAASSPAEIKARIDMRIAARAEGGNAIGYL